jgi:hypothetical protein
MSNFAIVENNIVTRVIVADKFEHAAAFFDPNDLIEETEITGIAWIGSEVIDGKFKPLQQYQSWTFDQDSFSWVAPEPYPIGSENPYFWDEGSLSWVEIPLPSDTEVVDE